MIMQIIAYILLAVLIGLAIRGFIIKLKNKDKGIEEVKDHVYWFNSLINDAVWSGGAILGFTLFFMGALDSYLGLGTREEFFKLALSNLNKAAEVTLDVFYRIGFAHPTLYIILFSLLVLFAIYNFFKNIFMAIKTYYQSKGGKK